MYKNIQLHIFVKCSRLLNMIPIGLLARLKKKIDQKILFIEDPARWRVEKAREMGAIIGENCRFYSLGFYSEPYLIEIGNNVILSGKVCLLTHDGGVYLAQDRIPNVRGHYGRIKIGNNCFIGMGAIILPNVEIGDNCIIGAGAVVMQSFPDNSVIMGNPGKVIFKTEMYLKMKQHSKQTLCHDKFPFPSRIPEGEKKKLLMEHFEYLSPSPARVNKKH